MRPQPHIGYLAAVAFEKSCCRMHMAVCCSVLQHEKRKRWCVLLLLLRRWVAVSCSELQCKQALMCWAMAASYNDTDTISVLQCVAVCCSALQCVATCCAVAASYNDTNTISVLQCVAVCCNVLQCVVLLLPHTMTQTLSTAINVLILIKTTLGTPLLLPLLLQEEK